MGFFVMLLAIIGLFVGGLVNGLAAIVMTGLASVIWWLVSGAAARHLLALYDHLMPDDEREHIRKHRTGEWD